MRIGKLISAAVFGILLIPAAFVSLLALAAILGEYTLGETGLFLLAFPLALAGLLGWFRPQPVPPAPALPESRRERDRQD